MVNHGETNRNPIELHYRDHWRALSKDDPELFPPGSIGVQYFPDTLEGRLRPQGVFQELAPRYFYPQGPEYENVLKGGDLTVGQLLKLPDVSITVTNDPGHTLKRVTEFFNNLTIPPRPTVS